MIFIAVASGKGGVGKTIFSINLAVALSLLRKKTILLDTSHTSNMASFMELKGSLKSLSDAF